MMEKNKESGTKEKTTYLDFWCGKANDLLFLLKSCDVSFVDFYFFSGLSSPHTLKW